jgi:SAM-dependent methyltransferase
MTGLSHYHVPDKYYASKLDRLLTHCQTSDVRHHEVFRAVDDEFWLWLHTEGVRVSPLLRDVLPGLPAESIQLQANGLSGDRALEDGFLVYRLFKTIYEAIAGELGTCQAILDFGCGWGRVIRFFLRDLEANKVWGVDHYDKAIETCQQTNRWHPFQQINPFPPTGFAPSTFDLILAYSVFSHLSEAAQRAWVEEFARLLRPGGVLIVTTWDRELILRCRELREDRTLPFFQNHLPTMFKETDYWLEAYDRGEFCFDTSVESYGAVSSYLGEACIPKGYVTKHWNGPLQLVDFIEDRTVCPQNVIVATRPIPTTVGKSGSDAELQADSGGCDSNTTLVERNA